MDSFVYQWTNKTLNKMYVGFHKGQEDDGYICSSSSTKFWDDFNNPEYIWERTILFRGEMQECQLKESEILDSLDITSDTIYNQKNNIMFNLDDEVRNKLSIAAQKRNKNPEYIKKLSEATKRQWQNPAYRARIKETHTGKKVSDETKEKLREIRKHQVITPESRMKAAESIKNKPNVICPHCGAEGRYLGSMKKKHFENCKDKI